MTLPSTKALIAMLAAAIVGMVAGLITLKLLGQPTPFG